MGTRATMKGGSPDTAMRCAHRSGLPGLRRGPGQDVARQRSLARSPSRIYATKVPINEVLLDPTWPDAFPMKPEDFEREDETSDFEFYDSPRLVAHIDDGAIRVLTEYYSKVLPPSGQKDVAILDVCSSWISHYPEGYSAGKISGLGMNKEELEKNPVLTDFVVRDLNENPKLPYDDDTFDVITNTVSVDYLTDPLEIFREMHRCLKPGGLAIVSFSNRFFRKKVIKKWMASSHADRVYYVGCYFHYSVPGGYVDLKSEDISPDSRRFFVWLGLPQFANPMYVVSARKRAQ